MSDTLDHDTNTSRDPPKSLLKHTRLDLDLDDTFQLKITIVISQLEYLIYISSRSSSVSPEQVEGFEDL
jgi:hypothetical protein